MKLVLATLATLALALPLSANAEKMELTFEKQPDGKYCGKFYSSKWSDRMTYQCGRARARVARVASTSFTRVSLILCLEVFLNFGIYYTTKLLQNDDNCYEISHFLYLHKFCANLILEKYPKLYVWGTPAARR